MSAQKSAGIQTLLEAEKEAQKIVQKDTFGSAREYRTKKVKDARSEAQKEIEAYKKQKDDEFKKYESEHTSGNKKAEEDAKKDADNKLKDMEGLGKKGGDKVVNDLLKAVVTVNPEPPQKGKSAA